MKLTYLIILLLLNTLSYSQEIRYVNAINGLNIREKPSLDSQKIGKFSHLEKIEVIKKTGVKLSIIDKAREIRGEWLKVSKTSKKTTIIGYVFDGYLINKKSESNMDKWNTSDFIVECPKRYASELKQNIEYERGQWKNVPNPFIATYEGNEFGDYHHINFEDSKGKTYDFGFGKNDFEDTKLFYEDKHLNDNPKYLGKTFKIFWKWRISSFPCCSGEYDTVKAYRPSILKLEIMEN